MATVYSIRDWDGHFEVSQSKRVTGPLTWVPLPCKHDGLGFRRIMAMDNGAAIYGAWVLLVQVAAKCTPRGVLADENGPFDTTDLQIKTGCAKSVFEEALNILSSKKIGWIIREESEDAPSVLPLQDSTGQYKTGQDRTQGAADAADRDEGESADSELRDWLHWWNSLKAVAAVPAGVNEHEPSRGALAAWKRFKQQTKEGRRLRALLADRDAVEREIRSSRFLRESTWFRFEKLLGGKNRDGELIIQKLMDGGYRDAKPSKTKATHAVYDPTAAHGDPTHGKL